MKRSPEVNS